MAESCRVLWHRTAYHFIHCDHPFYIYLVGGDSVICSHFFKLIGVGTSDAQQQIVQQQRMNNKKKTRQLTPKYSEIYERESLQLISISDSLFHPLFLFWCGPWSHSPAQRFSVLGLLTSLSLSRLCAIFFRTGLVALTFWPLSQAVLAAAAPFVTYRFVRIVTCNSSLSAPSGCQ